MSGPYADPVPEGSAVSRLAVKAYPGGFRPGKELGSAVSSTLVTASGGRRNALQARHRRPPFVSQALPGLRLFGSPLLAGSLFSHFLDMS